MIQVQARIEKTNTVIWQEIFKSCKCFGEVSMTLVCVWVRAQAWLLNVFMWGCHSYRYLTIFCYMNREVMICQVFWWLMMARLSLYAKQRILLLPSLNYSINDLVRKLREEDISITRPKASDFICKSSGRDKTAALPKALAHPDLAGSGGLA